MSLYKHKYIHARSLTCSPPSVSFTCVTGLSVSHRCMHGGSAKVSSGSTLSHFLQHPALNGPGKIQLTKALGLRTTIGMRLLGGAPGCGDLPRPASLLQNRQIRRASSQFVHQHNNIG